MARYGCYQTVIMKPFLNYEQLLTDDIQKLQLKINDMTGTNTYPNTFTYPYGKYNENSERIIKKLGFKASLSCTFGVNLIRKDNTEKLFGLKRICRAHNQNIGKLLEEAMKTLKYINE